MGKKFDLGDYIQQAESKMDTMPRMIAVELHLIDPSPANFYSMDGVESLADNIATVGLLEPLRVREKDGRYVVVSGHRRLAALRILAARGEMDPHDKIPVFLEDEPDTGEARDKDAARIALQQLRLIYANSDNRQYSSADKSREVQELTMIFSELKRLGYEFPGKIREHVAAAAHISDSRAARLAVIGKNLTTPHLREAYEAGRLGENAAYEIARRGAAVIGRADELPMASVCNMTLDRLGAVLEGLEKQAAEDAAEVKAYNDGVRAMQPETPTRSSFDAEAYLEERAREDDNFFEMLAGAADVLVSPLGYVNSRREGIETLKQAWKIGYSKIDDTTMRGSGRGLELEDLENDTPILRTWTDVYDMLCALALNRWVTADRMENGEDWDEDEDDEEAGPPRASAPTGAKADASQADPRVAMEPKWQTGEPTRPGRYFCRVRLGNTGANEQRGYWDDGWTFYGMRLQEGWEVLSWWPLPKEG